MSIALIAGTGYLPPLLAAHLKAQGQPPFICEMRGFMSEVSNDFTRIPFRIERLCSFLKTLQSKGVTQICMAGAVQRPDVDPAAIDGATAPLVPRLLAAFGQGDDGTLREIIAIFEEHGFRVIGAHEIVPDLLPSAGFHTHTKAAEGTVDFAVARSAMDDMGRADEGQALVLKGAEVIAREDQRGTAVMLTDLRAEGAVLLKAPKPAQILVADMPLIGPDTAQQAADAGLAGIVVAHQRVMVLDIGTVVDILNARDMFLWVAGGDRF